MPVNNEKKLIMIHIPKNAGTSIGIGLGMDYGGGHLTALELKNNGYPHWEGEHSIDKLKTVLIDVDDWYSYFKFAIVRNPFDRVVSNYEFIKSKNSFWHMVKPDGSKPVWNESICPPKEIHPEYEMTINKSFKEVVKEISERMKESYGWREQWPFILDENGRNMMDYVCKYEWLEEDLLYLCLTVSLSFHPQKLKKINKTNHKNYKEYYDDETIEIVSNIYKKDLEMFNYEF